MAVNRAEFHFTYAQIHERMTELQTEISPMQPESELALLDPNNISDSRKIMLILLADLGIAYSNLKGMEITREGMGYKAVLTRAVDQRD